MNRDNDCNTLPDNYRTFYSRIKQFIPEERLFCGPLRTLAYGTDASFYRLIPKIVVKAHTEQEVSELLKVAHGMTIPVVFRAGGTSLAGQAITDSVLVYLAGGWRGHRISDDGGQVGNLVMYRKSFVIAVPI